MTPEAPREPYWAVSEASFRMVMLSISLGASELNMVISENTPSMITSGSLPPESEVVPRTRILVPPIGSPPLWVITTPATLPFKASAGLETTPLFISSFFTRSMAPETVRLLPTA